jgi:hypothetical protein
MLNPSAFAVVKLMISENLVGCSTHDHAKQRCGHIDLEAVAVQYRQYALSRSTLTLAGC